MTVLVLLICFMSRASLPMHKARIHTSLVVPSGGGKRRKTGKSPMHTSAKSPVHAAVPAISSGSGGINDMPMLSPPDWQSSEHLYGLLAKAEERIREAEEGRRQAEEGRLQAEDGRCKAEQRLNAEEQSRRQLEDRIKQAEVGRRGAEEGRKQAEEGRRRAENRLRQAEQGNSHGRQRVLELRSARNQHVVLEGQVQMKKERLAEHEQTRECSVCMDKPACVLLEPCMHLCLCEACEPGPQCPLCRRAVSKHSRVHGQL